MSEQTQATPNNAGAATPAQSTLETPITQVVTATGGTQATTPQDDPATRISKLEAELEKTRREAANRRVENRDVKEQKSELEKTVEALNNTLKDLTTKVDTEKAQADAARREAALLKAVATHGLPESALKLFEDVPTEKIEEKAKALKEIVGEKPTGYKTTIGSTGATPQESAAQRIFNRMTGKGPSPFDADYHKAVGGGVIDES